jgi:hypothetical protein
MDIGNATLELIRTKIEDTNNGDPCEVANEYGEPGYQSVYTNGVILGNFWCRCDKIESAHGLHPIEAHYPRIFAALAEQGYELEWNDEWVIDWETGKAWRTSADSYSWTPSVVHDEYGELITPDSDIDEWIGWAKNETSRALTRSMVDREALEAEGWELVSEGHESGWYPGQDANPERIVKDIHRVMPWHDIIFYITSTGQFDMAFDVYVKPPEDEDDED